jgi:hypothetical protein
MRAAGAASLGAGTQRLVNDGLDGARAAAAFGAAAEATINLLGIPGEVFRAIDRTADIVVGQDVAGTNNHKTAGSSGVTRSLIDMQDDGGMQKEKPRFEAIPNYHSQSRTALK